MTRKPSQTSYFQESRGKCQTRVAQGALQETGKGTCLFGGSNLWAESQRRNLKLGKRQARGPLSLAWPSVVESSAVQRRGVQRRQGKKPVGTGLSWWREVWWYLVGDAVWRVSSNDAVCQMFTLERERSGSQAQKSWGRFWDRDGTAPNLSALSYKMRGMVEMTPRFATSSTIWEQYNTHK